MCPLNFQMEIQMIQGWYCITLKLRKPRYVTTTTLQELHGHRTAKNYRLNKKSNLLSRQPKAAGVFLLGTNGYIRPKSTEYMESACTINEDKVIHPFAFRTHTHSLGIYLIDFKIISNMSYLS
jgi:hypothetical protein